MMRRKKPKTCRCSMTAAEAERIEWLKQQNLKTMGRRYKQAAEDMAAFQVSMEHASRVHGARVL